MFMTLVKPTLRQESVSAAGFPVAEEESMLMDRRAWGHRRAQQESCSLRLELQAPHVVTVEGTGLPHVAAQTISNTGPTSRRKAANQAKTSSPSSHPAPLPSRALESSPSLSPARASARKTATSDLHLGQKRR